MALLGKNVCLEKLENPVKTGYYFLRKKRLVIEKKESWVKMMQFCSASSQSLQPTECIAWPEEILQGAQRIGLATVIRRGRTVNDFDGKSPILQFQAISKEALTKLGGIQ